MSTINSYFKARKNRNTPVYISDKEKAFQSGTTIIQAQEKIHQQQIEPIKNEQQKESPSTPTKQAKGILRYLSPISKEQVEKDNNNEQEQEQEQEEHIVCKIKKPTKLTDFWKDMVENYDRQSHTNQLQSDDTDDCITTATTTNRKKKRSQEEGTSRNVRIRMSNQTLLSQSTLPEYYYADDDESEDLTRPIRRRFSLSETNAYLLEIVNELSMDDNSWCQLKPVSTMS